MTVSVLWLFLIGLWIGLQCVVVFVSILTSQSAFFSHVGTGLPGLNQY